MVGHPERASQRDQQSSILYPDIRREHHPPAPLECGLRRLCRRPRRPPQLQLRTRFLPRSIRPHSPNLHLRCLTIPASLPITHPTSFSRLSFLLRTSSSLTFS